MTGQDKTEDPTPRRLRKAREEGQVAVSRDLTGAVLLIGALATLGWQRGTIADAAVDRGGELLHDVASSGRVPGADQWWSALGAVLVPWLPVLLVAAVAAVAVSFLQVGALLTLQPLLPKLERVSPIHGLRRLLGPDSWVQVLKSVVVLAVIGATAWVALRDRLAELLGSFRLAPSIAARTGAEIVGELCAFVLVAFLVVGVLDLAWQRWRHGRKLRMTRQEVRREQKDDQGSPEHRAARQRAHEEIVREAMMHAARRGDVCVVNPTHVACILRFDPDEDGAPRILARGRGRIAERLRAIAREEGIPTVRNVPLARALVALDLDRQIPVELHDAAEAVFVWAEHLLEARGRVARWRMQAAERARRRELEQRPGRG